MHPRTNTRAVESGAQTSAPGVALTTRELASIGGADVIENTRRGGGWFLISDSFYDDPRVVRAGNRAVGAWVRIGSWCAQYSGTGWVPRGVAQGLAGRSALRRLVECGLIHDERDGYQLEFDLCRLPAPGASLPTWLRELVLDRDGLVCGICLGAVEAHDVHIDHIWPRARGGGDELSNLRVTHSRCNMQKGARI